MANYSAIQVISPAVERTRQYLFRPFRLGRFLKLTLVALLTEGGMASCNFNSSVPSHPAGGSGSESWHLPALHWPALLLNWPAMVVVFSVIAAVALIVIPVSILISYLLIRLRFSYFDCVLYGQDRIGPAWSRYHRQALRYLGLTVCIGIAFWVVLIPIGYALYQHFKPLVETVRDWIESGTQPNLTDFLPLFAVLVPLGLGLALLSYLIDLAMGSFVLPRMALEDASIRDALEDVWGDIQAEPGQFALFVVMRALMSFVASIVAVIALAIPTVIVVIVGAILGLILKAFSTTLLVVLGVPAAVLLAGLLLLAFIGVSGTIGTFRRNYGLLFYGGRYPELGMRLWPPPAHVPLPGWEGGAPPVSPNLGPAGTV